MFSCSIDGLCRDCCCSSVVVVSLSPGCSWLADSGPANWRKPWSSSGGRRRGRGNNDGGRCQASCILCIHTDSARSVLSYCICTVTQHIAAAMTKKSAPFVVKIRLFIIIKYLHYIKIYNVIAGSLSLDAEELWPAASYIILIWRIYNALFPSSHNEPLCPSSNDLRGLHASLSMQISQSLLSPRVSLILLRHHQPRPLPPRPTWTISHHKRAGYGWRKPSSIPALINIQDNHFMCPKILSMAGLLCARFCAAEGLCISEREKERQKVQERMNKASPV